MNLIDTNGINHIFSQNLTLDEIYYLAPDIVEEVELTMMVYSKKLPSQVLSLSQHQNFDAAVYISHYKEMLNRHRGRSFYNMTGFGDISILASIHALKANYEKQKQECLFDFSEQIVIFTNDGGLTKRIANEFDQDIAVTSILTNIQ